MRTPGLTGRRKRDEQLQNVCVYSLVMPLRELDIRRGELGKQVRTLNYIELGRTNVKGGRHVYHDKVETPFRDGAHSQWDADVLGLTVWAVCGDTITKTYPKDLTVIN